MENILKDVRVLAVARENSRLVSLNAIPKRQENTTFKCDTGNVLSKRADVVRFVSTMHMVALNRFIFFASLSRTSIS